MRRRQSYGVAAILGMIVAGMAWGQGGPATAPATPEPRHSPIALPIWAQALEKPDLRYQLTPRYEETSAGNAALKYLLAAKDIVRKDNDYITEDTLRYCPLKDLDEKVAGEYLLQYSTPFKYMREGALLDGMDWESNIRKEGMSTLLPWLSSTRGLANALSIAIRVDIKNHHWADAQEKLQTGYAMARQMGHGETLIECLVGAAIQATMNNCVEEWVSEPGAPNMYWPLTNLPQIVDCQRAIACERSLVFITLPELRQMRDGPVSRETWIAFIGRFSSVSTLMGAQPAIQTQSPEVIEASAALFAAAEYPRAKALLEARGMKKDDVEKMAVADVVGKYFERSFEEASDDVYKSFGLPVMQAIPEAAKADVAMGQSKAADTGNLLARIVLPSLGRAAFVTARGERQVAMLRTVEAIRAYAAQKGALPEKLEDLTLPLPLDPYTGKPLGYERHGDGASVIGTYPDSNVRDDYRYDLTLQH